MGKFAVYLKNSKYATRQRYKKDRRTQSEFKSKCIEY